VREQLIQWQLRLRMIFVTRIALLKYRLRLPGFDLPLPLQAAQRNFDAGVAARLDAMADRLEGKLPAPRKESDVSIERLEQIALECCAEDTPEHPVAPLQTFLPLSRRIDHLLNSVEKEIASIEPVADQRPILDTGLSQPAARRTM
jgi:multidrug resistance protein MdtO